MPLRIITICSAVPAAATVGYGVYAKGSNVVPLSVHLRVFVPGTLPYPIQDLPSKASPVGFLLDRAMHPAGKGRESRLPPLSLHHWV